MNLYNFMMEFNTKTTNELDLYIKIEGLGAPTTAICKNDCLDFFDKASQK